MPEDVLSKIRPEDLGRAILELPACETTPTETIEYVIVAEGIGSVRITFKKFRKHRGRARLAFWLATSAYRTLE